MALGLGRQVAEGAVGVTDTKETMAKLIFRYMVGKEAVAAHLAEAKIELFEILPSESLYEALFVFFGIDESDEDGREDLFQRLTDAERAACGLPTDQMTDEQALAQIDKLFDGLKLFRKDCAAAMH